MYTRIFYMEANNANMEAMQSTQKHRSVVDSLFIIRATLLFSLYNATSCVVGQRELTRGTDLTGCVSSNTHSCPLNRGKDDTTILSRLLEALFSIKVLEDIVAPIPRARII